MTDKERLDILDKCIEIHGQENKVFITQALEFLDKNEGKWNLSKPINREKYIEGLIFRKKSGE